MSKPQLHNDTESRSTEQPADGGLALPDGGCAPRDKGRSDDAQTADEAADAAPDAAHSEDGAAKAQDAAGEGRATAGEDAGPVDETAEDAEAVEDAEAGDGAPENGRAEKDGAEEEAPADGEADGTLSPEDADEAGAVEAEGAEASRGEDADEKDADADAAADDAGASADAASADDDVDAADAASEDEGEKRADGSSDDAEASPDSDRDGQDASDAEAEGEKGLFRNAHLAENLAEHLVPIEAPEITEPLPEELASYAQEAPVRRRSYRPEPSDPRKDRRLGLVLSCVALAIVLAFAAVTVYFNVQGQQAAAVFMLPSRAQVTVGIDAAGLDTATGTKIPLHVVGTDEDGNQVDEVAYLNADGTGLIVVPGSYQVSIAASPIAADGTVYTVPDTVVAVEVPAVAKAELEADPFVLEPLAPEETTAEAIDDAYTYAVRGGCPLDRAPELKIAAEQRAGLQ